MEDHSCSLQTGKEQDSVPPVEYGSSSTPSVTSVLLGQAFLFKPVTKEKSNRRATVSPTKQVRIVEPTWLKTSNRRKSVSTSKLKCSPAIKKHCGPILPVSNQKPTKKAIEHEVTINDGSSPQNGEDNGVLLTCGHLDEETSSSLVTLPYKELPHDPRRTDLVSQGELLLVGADSVDLVVGETEEEEQEGDREHTVKDRILSEIEVEGQVDIFEAHPATGEPAGSSANLNSANDVDNHAEAVMRRDQMSSPVVHTRNNGEESQPASGVEKSASEDGTPSTSVASSSNMVREINIEHHAVSPNMSCFADDCSQNLALQLKPLLKSTNNNTERGTHKIAAKGNDITTQTAIKSPVVLEEPPRITTRSIARLSDDTTMLKAFLNRAQAKKAAMDVKLVASEDKTSPAISSRSSPRKALAERDLNSPSSHKQTKLAHRPGTPPSKRHLQEHLDDGVAWEDIDEITTAPLETQPTRRSGRSKKLPVPVKGATPIAGTLSLIPVRRAEGTDPIILQKGNAQELAIMTRANTRRNKGQAKLPTFMLEELQLRILEEVEQERSVTRSQTKEARKNVGWDEKLVYFQQTPEAGAIIESTEEKQPRIRRLRGLGGVNGTPAPKRTVDMPLTSPGKGTPAPKRRGKVRP